MITERAGWLLLYCLIGIDSVSIFGYATFSLHPELLAKSPWAAEIFGHTYSVFARAQILIAFLSLSCALIARVRRGWLPSFFWVFSLSLTSEIVGVAYGIPFGHYTYTELLGPKLWGVPLLIPTSWYFMTVACYRIADALAERASALFRCTVSALLLSAWDLTLDPAMSHLSPFWLWGEKGVYYGSPLLNLFGWFVTGFVLAATLELLQSRPWLRKIDARFTYCFYGANLLLPVGLVVCSGLWGPILVSLAAYAVIGLWTWISSRRARAELHRET